MTIEPMPVVPPHHGHRVQPGPHPHPRGHVSRPGPHHRPVPPPPPIPDDELPELWLEILSRLDFAFQPIVNVHTGFCFGYEALLRNTSAAGFDSIANFFDVCHAQGVLPAVEAVLREKILAKFADLPHHGKTKLFINVDNRSLDYAAARCHTIADTLTHFGLSETDIAFEVSEGGPVFQQPDIGSAIRAFKKQTFKLAIDDFGTGYSGLQLLYFSEPEFVKIDRFFVADIATDARKKLLLQHIVNIAHLLGVVVIAEGVETDREFLICKGVGCDLVQGYLVQRPTTQLGELRLHYSHIEELSKAERRVKSSDHKYITDQIEKIEPVAVGTPMLTVFQHFRSNKDRTFLPVIDLVGVPLGIVRERDLKNYTYSTYGKDLIANKAFGYTLQHFLSKCPIADIHTPAERLLESFSAVEDVDGILIVENMRYVGFLSAHSLLRVINEKNIAIARDQNPLTKLPGNNIIHEYVSNALADVGTGYIFVYYDFDNFKPFNDKYGFRQGDRAILLFAEILRKMLNRHGCFIGHIGGDDFFAGFKGMTVAEVEVVVRDSIAQFSSEVLAFYDDEARAQGCITALDREGNRRSFPLLSCSAAILETPCRRTLHSVEEISWLIADLKKEAKKSPDRTCTASLVA